MRPILTGSKNEGDVHNCYIQDNPVVCGQNKI